MQFAQRRNTSEVEETLNSQLALRAEAPRASTEYRNAVSLVVGVKPYRYMSERITEKGKGKSSHIQFVILSAIEVLSTLWKHLANPPSPPHNDI